jgi:hypothetical protein
MVFLLTRKKSHSACSYISSYLRSPLPASSERESSRRIPIAKYLQYILLGQICNLAEKLELYSWSAAKFYETGGGGFADFDVY